MPPLFRGSQRAVGGGGAAYDEGAARVVLRSDEAGADEHPRERLAGRELAGDRIRLPTAHFLHEVNDRLARS